MLKASANHCFYYWYICQLVFPHINLLVINYVRKSWAPDTSWSLMVTCFVQSSAHHARIFHLQGFKKERNSSPLQWCNFVHVLLWCIKTCKDAVNLISVASCFFPGNASLWTTYPCWNIRTNKGKTLTVEKTQVEQGLLNVCVWSGLPVCLRACQTSRTLCKYVT